MQIVMPDIPETERTPLVEQLLQIIHHQQERIHQLEDQVRLQQERIAQLQQRVHQLEDEIARLKGLKTRPRIAPSTLETPPRPPRDPNAQRPGSAKRSKTVALTITEETVVPLPYIPQGAVFKVYEDFVVQDLTIGPRVILYHRERWMTADGQSLVAEVPTVATSAAGGLPVRGMPSGGRTGRSVGMVKPGLSRSPSPPQNAGTVPSLLSL
jgi:hypothetical protein